MKIYTKTGDKGETGLWGGTRVSKANLRLDCYGTVDELNSFVGMLRSYQIEDWLKEMVVDIQKKLLSIGSYLSSENESSVPEYIWIKEKDISFIERKIDELEQNLRPLTRFILPGGHPLVSFSHMARTVCRRAERLIVELGEKEEVKPNIVQYLNRLSDFLFVLSRYFEQKYEVDEIEWNPKLE